MKLNLLLDNPDDYRNGYTNIDPFAQDERFLKADVSNLDHSYDEGEVEEIVAHEILDYFPIGQVNQIINGWLAKLAPGGKLIVSTVDIREVSRLYLLDMLSIEEVSELIHGASLRGWDNRKTSFTMSQFVELFKSRGLRVLSARVDRYLCVVTCERP